MNGRSVRLMQAVAFTSLLMITLSAFAATVSGPVVVLPNSYYLQPDKGGQTKLVKHNGSRLLPDTIAAYVVSGEIVIGALGPVPTYSHDITNDLEFTGTKDTRYFILDTATGKLQTDLDEATWRMRMKELGLRSDLQIYPPLPWQN